MPEVLLPCPEGGGAAPETPAAAAAGAGAGAGPGAGLEEGDAILLLNGAGIDRRSGTWRKDEAARCYYILCTAYLRGPFSRKKQ